MRLHQFSAMLVQLEGAAGAGRRPQGTMAAPVCTGEMRARRWEWATLTGLIVALLIVSAAWPLEEKKLSEDPSAKDEATAEPEKAPPRLDLDALEQRLRETDAIGFFTKVALASQINSLLETFRLFHKGEGQTTREELWERYYLLLFKVVTLLQDGDAELAQEIYGAREELWELLLDPKTFDQP